MEVEVADSTFVLAFELFDGLEATLEYVCMDRREIVFTSLKLAGACRDEFGCGQGISEVWDKEGGEGYVKRQDGCQEAAFTRRIAWRRSGGGVGFGPSGKQLHPATPELTAWQKRPADGSQ